MSLHQTTGKPDWADMPKANYNYWQRIAAYSSGIITPGNIITLVGIALVAVGLSEVYRHQYAVGIVALIVGRLADLLDGLVAEKTRTKSPLGEILDASIDKISTVLTVVILYALNVAAGWQLLALLLPHIIIMLIVVSRRVRHKLH